MALNKTIFRDDLALPDVAAQAAALKRFARRMFWRGDRFAVNGVLKRRWRIRWHKLWEYSRGLVYVPWKPDWRILDFGGGATLPVYFLADRGLQVSSYDTDPVLTAAAQALAIKRGWPLRATTCDLTSEPFDVAEPFDWAMSFCVLEHLPRQKQLQIARLLGSCLRPGGYLTLSFDYGPEAPAPGALRDREDVLTLLEATGLQSLDGVSFEDGGERFVLDDKHPLARFTFGSLFLRKS